LDSTSAWPLLKTSARIPYILVTTSPFLGVRVISRVTPLPWNGPSGSVFWGPFSIRDQTTPISEWDGKPESLKELDADSVLMIQIKQFWIEGSGAAFRTNAKTSINLVIHLGVKKEGKVFSKNVEVNREATLSRLTPRDGKNLQ